MDPVSTDPRSPAPLLALLAVVLALPACGGPRAARPEVAPVVDTAEPTFAPNPWAPHESATQRGIEALAAGDASQAVAWFDRAIDAGEDRVAALQNRAVAHLALAMGSAALADAADAVAAGGGDDIRFDLAAIQARLGLHAEAEPTLRELATHPVLGWDATRLLATVLVETGRADEALAILEQALADAELTAGLLNDVGVAAEAAGRVDDARRMYDRAIGADPDRPEPWRNLGMLELRAGRTVEAAAALERYLLIAPLDTIDRGVVQGRLDALRAP